MTDPDQRGEAIELVSRWQRSVLEAGNAAASLAALPRIFDTNLEIVLNGQKLGWAWLSEHMHELHARLRDIRVEVTHAATAGNVILERHIVSAVARESGLPWQAEVMAVYELTPERKIRSWHELARIPGDYTGW
jgi:hypothetical protein